MSKEIRLAGGTIRQIIKSMQLACNLSNEDIINILGNASVKYANEIDKNIKVGTAEWDDALNEKLNKESELVKPITDKLIELNTILEKTVVDWLNKNPDVIKRIEKIKEDQKTTANIKYYDPITGFRFGIDDVLFLYEHGWSQDISLGFNIGEINASIC